MSDHFSMSCDPVELSAAETKLGLLRDHLSHEGAQLARLRADSSGWTGAAATACLGETTRLSVVLRGAVPKVEAAVKAVKTFRLALETAQDTTLPRLNTRWDQSVSDYDTAAGKAGYAYVNEVGSYRNVPDEDAKPLREAAVGARDRAVQDASVARAGEQKGFNGEYDAMVISLEQAARACGAALAGAVPISFTADQWTKVKGGNIPMGMLASLRSQAFGQDSFVRQSDGQKAGEYVAGRLGDQARNGQPGDMLDPEAVALMDQLKGDKAFAQGLLTELGPGGAAFLNMRARSLYESVREGGDQEQGGQLIGILTDLYATGSQVRVPTDNGQSRPLMDQAWLDSFNPESYDQLGERYKGQFNLPTYVHGYRPDLLLPFMNKTGAFSSSFSQLVTQRALTDYEKFNARDFKEDALNRWQLYRGNDNGPFDDATTLNAVILGDSSNPFRTELFHIALDRAAEHPAASNTVMTTHRDTMLQLMTGKADWLTGGDNRYDWASPALAGILKQATVGSQGRKMTSADSALWGVADYLKSHPGEHMVKNVQVALGAVVLDKRFMNGAMSSVTSPFGSEEGFEDFRNDPDRPEVGPLMSEKLWAALHREAMGQPDTAVKIIAEVGSFIDGKSETADDLGYSWDQMAADGKGQWVQDPKLASLDLYQGEAARHFLGTNLKASSEVIKAELERELEENNQSKELAKNTLGTMVGWATDPTSIPKDLVGRVTDFAVNEAVELAMPTEDIQARYDERIKAQDKLVADPRFNSDPWTIIRNGSDLLINNILAGNVQTEVEAPQQGLDDPRQAAPRTYDGDPRHYVGRAIQPPLSAGGPAETADFLHYDSAGEPDGVKASSQMNPAQRAAYMKWLHDPAVQKFLGNRLAGVDDARGFPSS